MIEEGQLIKLNGAYDIGQLVSIRGRIIEIGEVKTTYPLSHGNVKTPMRGFTL